MNLTTTMMNQKLKKLQSELLDDDGSDIGKTLELTDMRVVRGFAEFRRYRVSMNNWCSVKWSKSLGYHGCPCERNGLKELSSLVNVWIWNALPDGSSVPLHHRNVSTCVDWMRAVPRFNMRVLLCANEVQLQEGQWNEQKTCNARQSMLTPSL